MRTLYPDSSYFCSKTYCGNLEGKKRCRLHRKTLKKHNLSWTARVTSLSLAIGETFIRTGFFGFRCRLSPFIDEYLDILGLDSLVRIRGRMTGCLCVATGVPILCFSSVQFMTLFTALRLAQSPYVGTDIYLPGSQHTCLVAFLSHGHSVCLSVI